MFIISLGERGIDNLKIYIRRLYFFSTKVLDLNTHTSEFKNFFTEAQQAIIMVQSLYYVITGWA